MEEEIKYEETPLLVDDEKEELEVPFIPPPAYQPTSKPVVIPVHYGVDSTGAMPLPTYEQSEKFEKEGVLEVGDRDRYEGTVRIITRQCEQPAGTLADFTIFFLVCLLFSWVGYIFACCLAISIAAQSGAAAGLGLSLVIKTIVVEFQPTYLSNMVHGMCSDDTYYYNSTDEMESSDWDACSKRAYSFLRLMFWIIGFLGLFLFARGLSVFFRTRPQRIVNNSNA